MKIKKMLGILPLFLLLWAMASCDKNDQEEISPINLSLHKVTLEGDGDSVVITTGIGDWQISALYWPNGMKITDGYFPLKLDSLGRIKSNWFTIVRDEPMSMKVIVDESFLKNETSFTIEVTDGYFVETVTINRKPGPGYRFGKIDYSIEEGDGETTYTEEKEYRLSYSNYTQHESQQSAYPYMNRVASSSFTCDDEIAFSWIEKDTVQVRVPVSIDGDQIGYGEQKRFYSRYPDRRKSLLFEKNYPFTIPSMKQVHVSGDIVYRKWTLSYVMTLINNRTGGEKKVKGKWTDVEPVDCKLEFLQLDLPARED